MQDKALIAEAKKAMEYAYAPYSNFKVGAALLTKSGKVYRGCNIENASYGDTICAERTAIFKAVSEGEREFDRIAICCSGDRYPLPCGLCLQVMQEFMPEVVVLCVNGDAVQSYTLKELLPFGFSLDV